MHLALVTNVELWKNAIFICNNEGWATSAIWSNTTMLMTPCHSDLHVHVFNACKLVRNDIMARLDTGIYRPAACVHDGFENGQLVFRLIFQLKSAVWFFDLILIVFGFCQQQTSQPENCSVLVSVVLFFPLTEIWTSDVLRVVFSCYHPNAWRTRIG